jgi:hypothetical protein
VDRPIFLIQLIFQFSKYFSNDFKLEITKPNPPDAQKFLNLAWV